MLQIKSMFLQKFTAMLLLRLMGKMVNIKHLQTKFTSNVMIMAYLHGILRENNITLKRLTVMTMAEMKVKNVKQLMLLGPSNLGWMHVEPFEFPL